MADEPTAPIAQAPLKTLSRSLPGPNGSSKRSNVPEGLWLRCTGCSKMIFRKQLESNLHVCPECGLHYRIGAGVRIKQLVDPETFEAMFDDLRCIDPLNFVDLKNYPDRIKAEMKRSGRPDAIIAGKAFIKGRPVVLACLDLSFMMGSMGSVVGGFMVTDRMLEMFKKR